MSKNGFFDELQTHCVHREEHKCPFRDEDGILVLMQDLLTMDDGVDIELCLWTEGSYYSYDLSTHRETFDRQIGGDFAAYLQSKGVPTENGAERLGAWEFGTDNRPDFYRAQISVMFDD